VARNVTASLQFFEVPVPGRTKRKLASAGKIRRVFRFTNPGNGSVITGPIFLALSGLNQRTFKVAGRVGNATTAVAVGTAYVNFPVGEIDPGQVVDVTINLTRQRRSNGIFRTGSPAFTPVVLAGSSTV
jgi:hypothetical protein